jgi:hypothetical protein
MLISKMQTYLSDKIPPKKVIIKKRKIGTYKIRNWFSNFNFLGGHFVTGQVCFYEISIYPRFLIPYMTYFNKKIPPQKSRFSYFLTQNRKNMETLRYLLPIQDYRSIVT